MSNGTLYCLFANGPTWDGDIPSKCERGELIDRGEAVRIDGWTTLTQKGLEASLALGFGARKEKRDRDRARAASEQFILEKAIDRMGWEEINAFNEQLARGQGVYEDAGGFFLRAIKYLFGIKPKITVLTYQDAARALLKEAGANLSSGLAK
jgi:hypothetical protein